MHLNEELLIQYNAERTSYKKEDTLFRQGQYPKYFFQVDIGLIKMSVFGHDHQEFIQQIFRPGESFGEPALLGNFPFPSSAIALQQAIVWKIPRNDFFQILKDHFDIHLKLTNLLARRLSYKTTLIRNLSTNQADERILHVIKFHCQNTAPVNNQTCFPFTRKELSNMTGLRIETVIRSVKELEKQNKLRISKHKIYLVEPAG